MNRSWLACAASGLFGAALLSLAGERSSIPELQPRPVKFSARALTLREVLAELKQTGNGLEDRRSHPTNPKILLPADPCTFWQVVDLIGKQTEIGFSAYQPGGEVALVDAPARALMTNDQGLFRFTFKRIAVSRDEETRTQECQLVLDVAWEPRLQPLYINLEGAVVSVAGSKRDEIVERQSVRSVSGSSATELDLRVPAPPRSQAKIEAVKGTIRMIAAPRMLEFAFKLGAAGQTAASIKAAPMQAVQEGVRLSLSQVKTLGSSWSVDVLIENPKDAIVPLESYQSWMDNNRVWLEWTEAKTGRGRKLEPIGEAPLSSPVGTKIRFAFTAQDKTSLPPAGTELGLRYRTPHRVVAFTVPFEFRNLPLP